MRAWMTALTWTHTRIHVRTPAPTWFTPYPHIPPRTPHHRVDYRVGGKDDLPPLTHTWWAAKNVTHHTVVLHTHTPTPPLHRVPPHTPPACTLPPRSCLPAITTPPWGVTLLTPFDRQAGSELRLAITHCNPLGWEVWWVTVPHTIPSLPCRYRAHLPAAYTQVGW